MAEKKPIPGALYGAARRLHRRAECERLLAAVACALISQRYPGQVDPGVLDQFRYELVHEASRIAYGLQERLDSVHPLPGLGDNLNDDAK